MRVAILLKYYTPSFSHAPRVKSGTSTGRLPLNTDCLLSSVMHDHSAASYTSIRLGKRNKVIER